MKNPFKRKSKAERMANNTKAYLCSMLNTKTAAQLKVVLERTKEAIDSNDVPLPKPYKFVSTELGHITRKNVRHAHVFVDKNNTPMFSLVWPGDDLNDYTYPWCHWRRQKFIEEYCIKVDEALPLMDDVISTLIDNEKQENIEIEKRRAFCDFIEGRNK